MMLRLVVLMSMLGLQLRHCAADLCNWAGSGFAAAVDSRIVLQVRLRCTEGSVRWIYPGQALRVVLEPNLSSARRTTVCIKPSPSLRGASVFIERSGELELLATGGGGGGGRPEQQVFCFRADGPHRPVIYLQSSPQTDGAWSRRTMGFRYELLGNRSAASNLGLSGLQTSCRPCNDTELLMAVCNSDFVVRGSIKNVSHDSARQTSLVQVSAARVYWQRSGVFEQQPTASGSPWRGHIHTLLQCHVQPGDGEFLFTGSEHFGEAWLGCAPRYKDFLSVYQTAWAARRNSCDFPLD
ncbi:meteorin-like protein [Sparus aurata]|uniref:Meteorin-like protein n=1 Tax=Sparus aurata TaxID=8175 RepID=A0A671YL63_SPAAU|nr:meteorin-like protein [Sparus aurata]